MGLNKKPGEYFVGVEWTNTIDQKAFLENLHRITCFELIPENFFDNRRIDFLKKMGDSGMPVLVHGVELSFGTAEPLKQKHFDRILEVADRVNTVNLSDHLSMTEAGGVEIGQLTPLPWTSECVDAVCRNIEKIQSQIRVSFMIENITNRFLIPEMELSETEFINAILKRTGCGLLLDLNNVHTNATNFHFDPFEWIDGINLKSVMGIHLAGGVYDEEGTLLDSHDNTVPERVWDLFRFVCERVTPKWTIVERTGNPPPYETLLGESDRANAIVDSTLLGQTASRTSSVARGVQL